MLHSKTDMPEKYLGINVEYPEMDYSAMAKVVIAAKVYHLVNRFKIYGELPKSGPAFVVGNHTSLTNILEIVYAGVETSGRMVRGVAKETLLNPEAEEPEEVLERTGKKNKFDPLKIPFIRRGLAGIINGTGTIAIVRFRRMIRRDRAFLEDCHGAVDGGEMLGMFGQESRFKEGDLREFKPGIGILMRERPNVPVIPVGFWVRPYERRLMIGDGVSYNQLVDRYGKRLSIRESAAAAGDMIADLLPYPMKEKWIEEDRDILLRKP